MVPRRLRGLEEQTSEDGLRVFVADSFRARLLGLALLSDLPANCALLLPECSAVHTLGMRFRLEVRFLDEAACELRVVAEVPPNRLVCHRGAAAVLERRCATSKRDCA